MKKLCVRCDLGARHLDDGDAGFQIAPMIDVVFVVMLFFMASAGMQTIEKEIGSNLPGLANEQRDSPAPALVEISADGDVRLNGTPCGDAADKALPALRSNLKTLVAQLRGRAAVTVAPDSDTRHERV